MSIKLKLRDRKNYFEKQNKILKSFNEKIYKRHLARKEKIRYLLTEKDFKKEISLRYKKIEARIKNRKETSLYKLVQCLIPHKTGIILGLIFGILSVLSALGAPMVVQQISTLILNSTRDPSAWNEGLIIQYSLVSLGLYLFSAICEYCQYFILNYTVANLSNDIHHRINEKFNHLPLSYFDNKSLGEILDVALSDVTEVESTLNSTLSSFVNNSIKIVGSTAILFYYSWMLGLIAITLVPFNFFIILTLRKKTEFAYEDRNVVMDDTNAFSLESIESGTIINSFNANDYFKEKFNHYSYQLANATNHAYALMDSVSPIMDFFGNIIFSLICLIGAKLVIDNKGDAASVAMLVAAISYVRNLISPVKSMAVLAGKFSSAIAAGNRVFKLLDEKEETRVISKESFNPDWKNMNFKHVRFSYQKNHPIIHDFNLKVNKGETVAIVGKTGAGKTTLINLLVRFYDVDSGEINLENLNIQNVQREELRNQYSMVLQDVYLFEGSIMDNLKFGDKNIKDKDVYLAVKNACASDIIKKVGGYDATLKGNIALSNGEKQLLTIARAMVHKSPMLILDEATSSVDTRTEKIIQSAMDKLMKNRTSFVIAHRLSTIRNANVILVMDHGDVIESGTHDELLKKNGYYASLLRA